LLPIKVGHTHTMASPSVDKIKERITLYPNFPKEGIDFKDIFPLFQTPSLVDDVIQLFVTHCKSSHPGKKIDAVIGLDSRGFLFGPQLAKELGATFTPARKRGKLPGETYAQNYSLEYGNDGMEMQKNALSEGSNVVIVDDLLATGGTMSAACKLAQQASLNILSCVTVVELTGLKGASKLPSDTQFYSIVQYEF